MKYTIQIVVIIFLLCACSSQTAQSATLPIATLTVISQPSETPRPTGASAPAGTATIASKKIIAVTKTPIAQLPEEATAAALGITCQTPTSDYETEISPDGRWIAMICKGQYGIAGSYLRVTSIQDGKNWSIKHADYAKIVEYDTDGMIYPLYWSTDGEYLYATSPSRMSGCCWIGSDLLLVRLNLNDGQQIEIANYISDGRGIPGADFSVSPNDRYVLSLPQDGSDSLYILDQYTWQQRAIKIVFKHTGAGYALMSNNSKKIILMLREYPKEYQGDLTYGSLLLIDLDDGSQRKLLSGMEFDDTPIPVRWKDDDHVLLRDSNAVWLLNIQTAELTKTEKP